MAPSARQTQRTTSYAAAPSEISMYGAKRPPKKDLLRSTVTINVGSGQVAETFTPHCELLMFYSPYFKTMMNGNWEEAKSNIVNLPADEPMVYEVFQDWLYGVDLSLEDAQMTKPSLMLKLWIFGDKVQVPGFQNAAMEALRYAVIEPPFEFRLKDIQFAFNNSGEGSPLRKFIVDLYVWECPLHGQMDKFQKEGYPQAFITQVFEGYVDTFPRPTAQTVKKNRPYAYSAQYYYVHYGNGLTGGGSAEAVTEG
ncbi:MAG: hypothetical protein Q9169_000415 [Polycauliona sp. 2 TL-2023]